MIRFFAVLRMTYIRDLHRSYVLCICFMNNNTAYASFDKETPNCYFLHFTYPQTTRTAASVESINNSKFPGFADKNEPFQHI